MGEEDCLLCLGSDEIEPDPVGEEDREDPHGLDQVIAKALLAHSSCFLESQNRDARVKKIIDSLSSSPRGKADKRYSLRNDGVLLWETRVVIPEHEIPLILWMTHDHPMSGHVGTQKVLDKIAARFYWPNMAASVKRYISKCSCQRTKAKKGHRTGHGRTMTFSHYGPLDCLQMDLVGPFPLSRSRNLYWLTLIDRYTRAVEFIPLPSNNAKVVARAIFTSWISRYGAPLIVLADNEFRAKVVAELFKLTGTKKIHSAPYKPSTNGLCERVHSFAEQILQNANKEKITNWDTFLPAVRFAIMTSKLDGLGFSPYQLLFGRHARLPVPVDSLIPVDSGVPVDIRDYFDTHMECIKHIRQTFDYNQSKADARMRFKRDHGERRKPVTLKEGDLVYHTRKYYSQSKAQRGLSKLLGKWAGPARIVKKIGNSFEVQVDEKNTKIFNAMHLSLYKGEDPPEYRAQPESKLLEGPEAEAVEEKQEPSPIVEQTISQEPLARLEQENGIQPKEPVILEETIPDSPLISEDPGEDQPELSIEKSFEDQPELSIEKSFDDQSGLPSEEDTHSSPKVTVEAVLSEPDSPTQETKSLPTNGKKQAKGAPKLVAGRFVLMFEKALHRKKKTSLVIGRVTSVDSHGIGTIHVWKPKRVHKTVHYLPLWWRREGQKSSDLKITDMKLSPEWYPWEMSTTPSQYELVAVSHINEMDNKPPQRFTDFYTQVWDKRISESAHPEEYREPQQADANLTIELAELKRDKTGPSRKRERSRGDALDPQRQKRQKTRFPRRVSFVEPSFTVTLSGSGRSVNS